MFLRKLYQRITGVTLGAVNDVLKIKRLNRLKKNSEFTYFIITHKSFESFQKKLKDNIDQFPSGTRFQLLIKNDRFLLWHYWMVDFYIVKDAKTGKNILKTFTMDAAGVHYSLELSMQALKNNFPLGEHYAYYPEKQLSGMQKNKTDCQTYAIEHAAIVAKIDPEKMYSVLQEHTSIIRFVDANHKAGVLEGFSEPDLYAEKEKQMELSSSYYDDMKIFAPLFRSSQRLETLDQFHGKIKDTTVSKKNGGLTLGEWVESKKAQVTGKDKKVKTHNMAIKNKQQKYLNRYLKNNNMYKYNNSGEHFLNFPQIARIKNLLETEQPDAIMKLMEDFISHLNKNTPKTTKKFTFFCIPSKHSLKTKAVLKALQGIVQHTRNEMLKTGNDGSEVNLSKLLAVQFGDIMYDYCNHLKLENSERTLNSVNTLLNTIETSLHNKINIKS